MRKPTIYFASWALSVLMAFSAGLLGGAKVILSMKKAEVVEDAARIAELQREAEQYEEMICSWYGPGFHGRRTASGEIYDMMEFTAAHRTLPFNTFLILENTDNGRFCVVRISDRGPAIQSRHLDVSLAAARALGMESSGTAVVKAKVIGRPSIGD